MHHKRSSPPNCSPLNSTSTQINHLTIFEPAQPPRTTSAPLTYLNRTYTSHLTEQALELNFRTITKPNMPYIGVVATLRNPWSLPMPCHNHATLIPPDMETVTGTHNATRNKHARKAHAYQPHPLFMGGIYVKELPKDITRAHMLLAKITLHPSTQQLDRLYPSKDSVTRT